MPMTRNYKEDLKIDQNNLEKEWLEQPSLYMYYAEAYADAILERDEAKNELERIYCKLDNSLIKDWEKYFDKSPSEQMRKNKIFLNQEYKKALAEFDKCTHNVNLLQAAKYAFDHRRKALEHLVTLLVSGFHSEPTMKKSNIKRRHLGLKKQQ